MGKHRADGRSVTPLVLATTAVVGVVVVVFLAVRLVGGSLGPNAATSSPVVIVTGAPATVSTTSSASPSTTSTTSATTASATVAPTVAASPTTSPADLAARAALTACVDHQNAAAGLVTAMATGAGHWSDHLQGQTDISAHTRSYIDVKTTTWGPTRAAGPGDVAAFQAGEAALAPAPACPTTVGDLPATADLTSKLKACSARLQALDAVVATGSQVLRDWTTHLTEMAAHTDGHLGGPVAEATWIQRWRDAPTHLDPYRAATGAWGSAPACTV